MDSYRYTDFDGDELEVDEGTDGGVVISAVNHKPDEVWGVVAVDGKDLPALIEFLQKVQANRGN